MGFYELKVAGVTRQLQVVSASDDLEVACFVLLGDVELTEKAAALLKEKIPPVDVVITAEIKGIPIAHELARILGFTKCIVARKSVKPYMTEPVVATINSIRRRQVLCLDKIECDFMKGKRVLIVDDVISSGESLKALEKLVEMAGGTLVGKAAILVEGDSMERDDIISLGKLPVFPKKKI